MEHLRKIIVSCVINPESRWDKSWGMYSINRFEVRFGRKTRLYVIQSKHDLSVLIALILVGDYFFFSPVNNWRGEENTLTRRLDVDGGIIQSPRSGAFYVVVVCSATHPRKIITFLKCLTRWNQLKDRYFAIDKGGDNWLGSTVDGRLWKPPRRLTTTITNYIPLRRIN